MKKIILLCCLSGCLVTGRSQPVSPLSIEDSIIGWIKVHHFKGVKTGMKVDNKVYSANQLSISDSLANWMQASYMPKGSLGEIRKAVSEKLGLYNQYMAAQPPVYGAYAKTYTELRYNSSRKLEPVTNSNFLWDVSANKIPGAWPVRDICTPGQYYFLLPTAETEVDDEKMKALLDLTKEKNIQPYNSFWVKNMGYGGGYENVLLSKDNRFPFVKISRREYLQALETAIPQFYERERKKILEAEQGNQQRMAIPLKQLNEKRERLYTGLKKNREKYKDRLDEPAMTGRQPGFADLDNGLDVFGGHYLTDPPANSTRYPVYKVDPAIAEACKKDQPQWILVSWEYYPAGSDPIEKQLHEAIVNNFNFTYVYNFFFAPEKVKGQPYQPLRSPVYREAAVVTEASAATKKYSTDKNVHFFDDFSTTAIGKKPAGWYSSLSFGKPCVITKLNGLEGNWAEMANHIITPVQLSKPLPQNFTLSYDLVAPQGFTWGAKGLIFQLSQELKAGNPESYLLLKLRPGYDGKDGEAMLEIKFPYPPGYSNASKWLTAPGFSNNKQHNRITVTIKKKGESLQVFINAAKIADYEKAIPHALQFNALSFTSGNKEDNNRMYISHIKIIKE